MRSTSRGAVTAELSCPQDRNSIDDDDDYNNNECTCTFLLLFLFLRPKVLSSTYFFACRRRHQGAVVVFATEYAVAPHVHAFRMSPTAGSPHGVGKHAAHQGTSRDTVTRRSGRARFPCARMRRAPGVYLCLRLFPRLGGLLLLWPAAPQPHHAGAPKARPTACRVDALAAGPTGPVRQLRQSCD